MMKPLFRGLCDTEPAAAYDAVIIGAGIGGLFCANQLVREGLRVLLVEQHYRVGGYCSAFRRKGYTFDAAAHFYPLLGNPRTLTGRLLPEMGVTTRWVKMDPVDAFHLPDGTRFEVPADFDAYRRRLADEFPHEQDCLDRFFAAVREANMLGLLCYFRDRGRERLDRWGDVTLLEALERYIRDPRLRLLLAADCPHWGSVPSRTSFVFDSMMRLSYFLGNYYPVGGSQAFTDELARRFEEQGGDVLMSSRVDEILVRDGRACGIAVETTRGALRGTRRIAAGTVISNADLLQTFEKLLATQHVDPSYLEPIRRLRPSQPCFLTYVGLRDVGPEVLEAAQGYYWKAWDPELLVRDGLCCKLFVPTLYEPRMAPPGGQIVILQKPLALDYDGIDDWKAHKAEIEDYMAAHLERVIPGSGERTVVRLSASARTCWKYTLNSGGAMLGWEMSPDQLGDDRPGFEGPVDNLFLVGHWTRPGGGITPVIISALRVAEAVTR
ncbi:MAG: NAD(P)/FAD-dependent oxidoreductase [bacterium]|nr:NAD(P)/FAD-dependent oxidoreductase [bacterium]